MTISQGRWLGLPVLFAAVIAASRAGNRAANHRRRRARPAPRRRSTASSSRRRPRQFGGKIERNAAQSKPYWPPRVVPPKGAPNVLLIMTDDVGFGASARSAA